ncbi:MAG: hypothetical protein K9N49_09025 [Candidatus Marinimicrobia bacterium]|nr:hypothetical protein [Candidatus Neomarinimicrobiota bacterium]
MNHVTHKAGRNHGRHLILGLLMLAACGGGCDNNAGVAGGGPGEDYFRIEPSAVHLDADQLEVTFTVQGGIDPFAWEVSNPALGTISSPYPAARTATYRRVADAAGENTITVTDSHSTQADPAAGGAWRARAVVIQDAPAPPAEAEAE